MEAAEPTDEPPGASCRAAVCTRHHTVPTLALQELPRFGGVRCTSPRRKKKKTEERKTTMRCQDWFQKKNEEKEKKRLGAASLPRRPAVGLCALTAVTSQ